MLTAAQQGCLAKRYGEIFEVFPKHQGIARVTFWGLRDTDSWCQQDSPLIFDDAYGRKAAYDGVVHALTKAGKQAKRNETPARAPLRGAAPAFLSMVPFGVSLAAGATIRATMSCRGS